jgi:damage-control phosphatase, subfamily III
VLLYISYETVVKRWPIILTGIIDTIYRLDHEIGVSLPTLPAGGEEASLSEQRISEGKAIIERISKLKYEMARDRPLECVYVYHILRRET